MKRFLSAILALAMVVSVVSLCGGRANAAKALPDGVLYYWGFENDSDITAVGQMERRSGTVGTSTYELIPVNRRPEIVADQGVSGNALYLDGTYGVQLHDLAPLDLEAYTVSFWVYACDGGYYPPVVELGSNIGGHPLLGPTTWMEFFFFPAKGTGDLYPSVETYDSAKGVVEFPGLTATMIADSSFTTGKWKMITVVVDGEEFDGEDHEVHVGSKLYVDGKLAVDATAKTKSFSAALPGLLNGDAMEGYVGINYNNDCFHGFVDELYIFDRALDDAAIQKVYAAGNPDNVPKEMPKIPVPEITKNPTSETVQEGGNAYFVARGSNYNYINWYLVSPDYGTRIPVNTAPWNFSGLSVTGEGTTTLLLSNIPMSLDGWCVEATFTGDGGTATTSRCFVSVRKVPKTTLNASPSSGYFEYRDQAVRLKAASGDTIHYELRTEYDTYTGTVKSGESIFIPAISGIRYTAYLYAYVVSDPSNSISCQYTMDSLPSDDIVPDLPVEAIDPGAPAKFSGGSFSNDEAYVNLVSSGGDSFSANVGVLRLCDMNGSGKYSNGVVYMTLTDLSGNNLRAEYNVGNGTLLISSSTWEYLPNGTAFFGMH